MKVGKVRPDDEKAKHREKIKQELHLYNLLCTSGMVVSRAATNVSQDAL